MFEQLERRALLEGKVNVTFNGRDIQIEGDDGNNHIVLVQANNGSGDPQYGLGVGGVDGTIVSFNGKRYENESASIYSFFDTAVRYTLTINMGDGDDIVSTEREPPSSRDASTSALATTSSHPARDLVH